jgi:hypothetical protein
MRNSVLCGTKSPADVLQRKRKLSSYTFQWQLPHVWDRRPNAEEAVQRIKYINKNTRYFSFLENNTAFTDVSETMKIRIELLRTKEQLVLTLKSIRVPSPLKVNKSSTVHN